MPFVPFRENPDVPADPPLPPLQLAFFSVREVKEQLPEDSTESVRAPRWQLRSSYGYLADDGRYFAVPAHAGNVGTGGNWTDLTSVPGFLWGILGPYGQHLRSALLHDHRCEVAADQPDRAAQVRVRTEADDLFREALRSEGVDPTRRWIFWTGVTYGRFFNYSRVLAFVLGFLVFAAAVLGLHALTVALGGGPPRLDGWLSEWSFWLTLLGVAVLMAVLRRWMFMVTIPLSLLTIVASLAGAGPDAPSVLRSLHWHAAAAGAVLLAVIVVGLFTDVRAALIAMVLAPLILPVVLLTTLVQLTLALPDLIRWAARGYPEDEPVVGPTLGPPK